MKNLQNDKLENLIPEYVSEWTYNYFHHSTFDLPWKFPTKKILSSLSQFKKSELVILYRGVDRFNKNNPEMNNIFSWTYDIEVAKRWAEGLDGEVFVEEFKPDQIVLDTTLLNREQKIYMGYNYQIDNMEVLVKG